VIDKEDIFLIRKLHCENDDFVIGSAKQRLHSL